MNISLAAEPIAHFGWLTITNSMINAWMVTIILLIFVWLATRKMRLIPRGAQNLFEMFLEGAFSLMDSVTRDRERSKKFLPIVATLFLFILLNNWLGQMPGTGTIGIWETVRGEQEFVPLFRPATSDLNMTVALGGFAILATHVFGVAGLGLFRHGGKFLQVVNVVKSVRKGPIAIFTALIEFLVGIIEAAGEIAKTASLSLRLFGNIFAGEVLITVMLSLAAFVVPLPFQALELLVGVIQAAVFSILTLVFMTIATEPPHGEHAEEHAAAKPAH